MFKDYAVQVRIVNSGVGDDTAVIERHFKTDEARAKWIEKTENAGKLIEVLAFSDPQ